MVGQACWCTLLVRRNVTKGTTSAGWSAVKADTVLLWWLLCFHDCLIYVRNILLSLCYLYVYCVARFLTLPTRVLRYGTRPPKRPDGDIHSAEPPLFSASGPPLTGWRPRGLRTQYESRYEHSVCDKNKSTRKREMLHISFDWCRFNKPPLRSSSAVVGSCRLGVWQPGQGPFRRLHCVYGWRAGQTP